MKRILITGGKGLVGRTLNTLLTPYYKTYALGREQLDITNKEHVRKIIRLIRPDYIIHLAAFTQVDLCEKKSQACYQVNVKGTKHIIDTAQMVHAKLIYLSTDYVFDGEKHTPYTETDPKNPVNYYGHTKSLAEDLIQKELSEFFIIRPAWIFGETKRNFIHLVVELAEKEETLKFVSDQISTPTYAVDLSYFIKFLIDNEPGEYGIYHYTNEGEASRFEEAQYILDKLGYDNNLIPVSQKEFKAPAQRPAYSVLSKDKVKRVFGLKPRHWKEAMDECLARLFPDKML